MTLLLPPLHLLQASAPSSGSPAWLATVVALAALAAIAAIRRLAADFGGDLALAAEHRLAGLYLRLLHRARLEGFERIEGLANLAGDAGGAGQGLIVAANHTCGLDPVLLQMLVRRRIRWMMWTGQMAPALGWLWRHLEVLPVEQDGRDLQTVRAAVRALDRGEVLGIFPEGGIARPPGQVQAFQPGLGLLASRSSAPVLLCLVRGTPAPRVGGSFLLPSRSKVIAVGLYRVEPGERPNAFLERMRQSLIEASGWPAAESLTGPAAAVPR